MIPCGTLEISIDLPCTLQATTDSDLLSIKYKGTDNNIMRSIRPWNRICIVFEH